MDFLYDTEIMKNPIVEEKYETTNDGKKLLVRRYKNGVITKTEA